MSFYDWREENWFNFFLRQMMYCIEANSNCTFSWDLFYFVLFCFAQSNWPLTLFIITPFRLCLETIIKDWLWRSPTLCVEDAHQRQLLWRRIYIKNIIFKLQKAKYLTEKVHSIKPHTHTYPTRSIQLVFCWLIITQMDIIKTLNLIWLLKP